MAITTGKWIGVGLLVVIIIFFLWFVVVYNSLVSGSTEVDNQWSNVQTQYQRRADLIPNLVNTVQGVVKFESGTQARIAELRSQASAVKAELQKASTPTQLDNAAGKLDNVISQYRALNINVENYPQLRGVENFLSLQDELAGTENRIQISRERFNTAIKDYNLAVARFPNNIIAGLFGFVKKDFFQARAGSDVVPTVTFADNL